jgi:hypothetical protein
MKQIDRDAIEAWADFIEENLQVIYERKQYLNSKVDAVKSCVEGLRNIATR